MADFNGGPGDDTFNGDGTNEVISGNGGNDVLAGGGGADTINGNDGDDTLYSGTRSPAWSIPNFAVPPVAPVLDSGTEVDTLNGGTGFDTIFAGYGDNIDGGADGAALLLSLQGASSGVTVNFAGLANNGSINVGGGTITNITSLLWVDGSNFGDVINAGAFSPTIRGFGGNDSITVYGPSTSNIYGGDGNDYIDGSLSYGGGYYYGDDGNDEIHANIIVDSSKAFGGEGDDVIYGIGRLYGGAGNDTFYISANGYGLRPNYGDDGNDTFYGSAYPEALIGNAGADVLHGGDGDDLLYSAGLDNNNDAYYMNGGMSAAGVTSTDELDNGAEHDSLFGDGGNDRLSIGWGDDADGGTGINTLILSLGGATAGVMINASVLTGSIANGGGTITNIQKLEAIWGSAFGDTITLPTQSITATVHGGDGADTINAGDSAAILYGDAGIDTINGGAADDVIYGGAGADVLYGGVGNDSFYVTAASDVVPGESIDGASGTDTLFVRALGVDFSGSAISSVEVLDTSAFTVAMTAAQFASFSTYKTYDVTLTIGGTVTLSGKSYQPFSASRIVYLANADTVFNATGLVTATTSGINVTGGTGNDTITGTDKEDALVGGVGNDTLNGGAGQDTLTGGAGVDQVYGGAGYDTIIINEGDFAAGEVYDGGADSARLVVNATSQIDFTTTTLTSINSITGGNIRLTAAQLNMFADALGGVFTLTTGGTVAIGTFFNTVTNATVNLAPVDTVFSLTANYGIFNGALTINGNVGNDTISGTSIIDRINGGDGNDTLYGLGGNDTISGGIGNDIIDGGTGFDLMYGGAGDDTYYVDNGSDQIVEYANEGYDTVYSSIGTTLSANVERGILTGSGNNALYGNASDNWLIGNSGNNSLYGYDGNDRLDGGAGTDVLYGGIGDDTYVYDGVDTFVELANEGTDTVESAYDYTLAANFENLTLTGSANLIGTGNAANNVLRGNSGDNYLYGQGGTDTFYGGLGDDVYIVDSADDVVFEGVDQGNDLIKSSVSYTLAANSNIESLRLAGTANINATGDSGFNKLVGNTGDNVLDGGGGGDVLRGGLGNDTYIIRDATDRIVEVAGNGTDIVKAAVSYALEADAAVEQLLTIDALATTAINLTGNAYATVIQGNAGANVLTSGSANETLTGFGGADIFRFVGGNGQDHVGDFVSATDKLDLSAFFASFAAFQAATSDVGGSAVVTLGGSNTVTLDGVLKAQIQSGDVIVAGGGAMVESFDSGSDAPFGRVMVHGGDVTSDMVREHLFAGHFVIDSTPVLMPSI